MVEALGIEAHCRSSAALGSGETRSRMVEYIGSAIQRLQRRGGLGVGGRHAPKYLDGGPQPWQAEPFCAAIPWRIWASVLGIAPVQSLQAETGQGFVQRRFHLPRPIAVGQFNAQRPAFVNIHGLGQQLNALARLITVANLEAILPGVNQQVDIADAWWAGLGGPARQPKALGSVLPKQGGFFMGPGASHWDGMGCHGVPLM